MEFNGYSHNKSIQEEIEKMISLTSDKDSNDEELDDKDKSIERYSNDENDEELTKKYDMESKIKRKVVNELISQLQEMLYEGDNEDIRKRNVTSAKKLIKSTRKKNKF